MLQDRSVLETILVTFLLTKSPLDFYCDIIVCFGGTGRGDLLTQQSVRCALCWVWKRLKGAVLPAPRELGREPSLSTRQNTALK